VNIFGGIHTSAGPHTLSMPSFPSPFGGDDDQFDSYDEFVVANAPTPGRFLDGHDVLTGSDHLAFHRLTRELFEERTVYDMTFNYNLARLNLDSRHREAGYRYAEERPDSPDALDIDGVERVLRAEFTPTTPFCPQTHTLTIGSFRAWNGLADRHEYDLVRVRAAPMHQRSDAINDRLVELEESFVETGDLAPPPDESLDVGPESLSPDAGRGIPDGGADDGSGDAPF